MTQQDNRQETAMSAIYEQDYETITGELGTADLVVTRMPRARFMEIVAPLLQDHPAIAEDIRPVARSMTRFPLGTWMHRPLGCGCLIGEYLTASSTLNRWDVRKRIEDEGILLTLLHSAAKDDLLRLGTQVDGQLRAEVHRNGAPDAEIILIEDGTA